MPTSKTSARGKVFAWQNKEILRLLKREKIISVDMRKSLTPQKKAAITRAYKKHQTLVDTVVKDSRRKDENKTLVRRHVSKETAKAMAEKGYLVNGQTVWVHKTPGQKIKITNGKIVASDAEKATVTHITGNVLQQLEAIANKELPPGKFVTVRIGDRGLWKKYFSYADLLKYLSGWEPNNPNADRDDLISMMEIVEYYDID